MNFSLFKNKRLYVAFLLMLIFDLPVFAVLFLAAPLLWIFQVFVVIVVLVLSRNRLISILLTLTASILLYLFKIDAHSSDRYYVALFLIVPLWIGVLTGFKKPQKGE